MSHLFTWLMPHDILEELSRSGSPISPDPDFVVALSGWYALCWASPLGDPFFNVGDFLGSIVAMCGRLQVYYRGPKMADLEFYRPEQILHWIRHGLARMCAEDEVAEEKRKEVLLGLFGIFDASPSLSPQAWPTLTKLFIGEFLLRPFRKDETHWVWATHHFLDLAFRVFERCGDRWALASCQRFMIHVLGSFALVGPTSDGKALHGYTLCLYRAAHAEGFDCLAALASLDQIMPQHSM